MSGGETRDRASAAAVLSPAVIDREAYGARAIRQGRRPQHCFGARPCQAGKRAAAGLLSNKGGREARGRGQNASASAGLALQLRALPTPRRRRRDRPETWDRDDRAAPEDYILGPPRHPCRAGCRGRRTTVVRMEAVRRELRGIAIALVLVAATTLIAYVLIQLPRRAPRIGHLPAAGAARGLASRPGAGAGRGGRRRALVGISFSFRRTTASYLARPNEILNLVAVHGGRGGDQPSRQLDEAADRARPQAREGDERPLRVLAPARGGAFGGRHLSRDRGAPRQPGPAQGGAVRRRRRRSATPSRTRSGGAASACVRRSHEIAAGRTLAPRSPMAPATSGWSAASRRRTPDFGVIAIDLGSVPPANGRRSPPARRRRAVRRRRHARAARRRARAQRREDAFRDRAVARGADRLGLARIAHAAGLDPRRRDGAEQVAGDREGRAAAPRSPAWCATSPSASTTTSRTCSMRPASAVEQIRPRQEWIEPHDIVNSALERRRRRLAGHNVSLDMDSNLPLIYVDAVLVEQAFVQIVDNAAKYSPAGLADHHRGQAQRPATWCCRSRTRASGLTAEESAQLGERFFRGARHAATTSGSGLGLWIAKAFVTANGGKIEGGERGRRPGHDGVDPSAASRRPRSNPRSVPMTEANSCRARRRRRGADPPLPARRSRARRLCRAGRRDRRRCAALGDAQAARSRHPRSRAARHGRRARCSSGCARGRACR